MTRQLKRKVVDAIKDDWRIQMCQFEYLSHLKPSFIMLHLAMFTGALILCLLCSSLGLLSIPSVISWNCFVLFDKKRRAFKDDYKLKRYEIIGTAWASLVMSGVIVGLVVSWPFGAIRCT